MSSSVAFLTRLSLIAGEGAGHEACAFQVEALVHAYESALYARLGIVRSSRPTVRAKDIAIEALEELRRTVLKAELCAPLGAAAMYAVARDRIELGRRALTLRVTAEDDAAGAQSRRHDDRRRLDVIRANLRNKSLIVTSLDAITQSRELLVTR